MTFSLQGNGTTCTAEVTVVGELNFEAIAKHDIIVRVTDKGGLFKVANFTVTVVDDNDKPTVRSPNLIKITINAL